MDTPIYIISTWSKMITEQDLKDKRAKKLSSNFERQTLWSNNY